MRIVHIGIPNTALIKNIIFIMYLRSRKAIRCFVMNYFYNIIFSEWFHHGRCEHGASLYRVQTTRLLRFVAAHAQGKIVKAFL